MHDGPAGGGRRGDGRKKRSGMIAMRPNGRLEATLLALRPRAIDTVSQGCAPMVPVGVVAAETAPTSRTRVAIIGLGRQGSTICDEQPAGSPPYGIAGACRQSSVLEIVAGADIQLDKRLAFQERWGCKIPVFEDYVEMIEATGPDLVAICTAACLPKPARTCPDPRLRPDAHADLCVAVSNLGVPMIFCEKAIASSLDRLDEVTSVFERNGTKLATGQFRRYDTRFEVIRDAITDGKIGVPTGAVFFGQTSLMHGHVHTIDTLHFLLGDPGIASVRGELHGLPPESLQGNHLAEDPEATYELEFKNGVRAAAVMAGRGAQYEFEIIGTEGRIRCWHQLGSETVGSARDGVSMVLHGAEGVDNYMFEHAALASTSVADRGGQTVFCLEELVEAFASGREARGDIRLTAEGTEATIAVAISHLKHGGGWVSLPLGSSERDADAMYIFHV